MIIDAGHQREGSRVGEPAGRHLCVADQNAGHDRAVMDSPPSLRIFSYHLCETPQVAKVSGR